MAHPQLRPVSTRFGSRDLALLAAGQAVSVTGDSAALVALLLRLRPVGSGWVAALLAAELVPFVICAPLDAATFAVLTALVALVRARRPSVPLADRSDRPGAVGGLGLLWRARVLRVTLLVSAVATGCAVIDNVAAPFRFIDQLGTDDFGYGLYLTIWSVGALLGVQLLPRLRSRRHARALVVGNLVMGLAIAGIGLAPTFAVALIAAAAGGIGNGLQNVTQNALIATHAPRAAHGRAFAAAGATMQTGIGVGTAAAAPLVAGLGAGHAMALAGAASAVVALVGLAVLSAATSG